MFKENMDALAAHLENLIQTKTIIGEPMMVGNVTLIPVVTASFGFGLGDGEGTEPSKGGGKGSGGGAGAKINPTALVAIKGDDVQVFSLGEKNSMEKLMELVPQLVTKLSEMKSKKADPEEPK
jgi:uncharacterized spore protein YtfJ